MTNNYDTPGRCKTCQRWLEIEGDGTHGRCIVTGCASAGQLQDVAPGFKGYRERVSRKLRPLFEAA